VRVLWDVTACLQKIVSSQHYQARVWAGIGRGEVVLKTCWVGKSKRGRELQQKELEPEEIQRRNQSKLCST